MTDSIDVNEIKKLTGSDGFYKRTYKIGEEEPINIGSIMEITGRDSFFDRSLNDSSDKQLKECELNNTDKFCALSANLGTIGKITNVKDLKTFNLDIIVNTRVTGIDNDFSDELIESPSRSTYCGDIYSCALKDYQKRLRLKQEGLREGELDRDTHLQYAANVYSSVLKDEQKNKHLGSIEPQLKKPTEGRTGESKLRLGELERDAYIAYNPNWL